MLSSGLIKNITKRGSCDSLVLSLAITFRYDFLIEVINAFDCQITYQSIKKLAKISRKKSWSPNDYLQPPQCF